MTSVKSVDRAVDILLVLAEAPVAGIAELQQRLELPRPTLYRMLSSLEQKGLVSHFGEPRRYRLGHRVMDLSRSWERSFDVVEAGRGVLEALSADCQETAMLFVPSPPASRILVCQILSTSPLSYSRPVGYIAPLHRGAAGKAMLAFMPDHALASALEGLEGDERRRVQQDIERIRKDRFFVANGEMIPGALSVAAPVFGYGAQLLGSISVIGPESRMAPLVRASLVSKVLGAAREISRLAGHTAG